MTNRDEQNKDNNSRILNTTVITFAVQSGCAAVIVIGVFLGLGLWLDAQFGNKHWFTFGLLMASIPVSLLAMLKMARLAISKIKVESGASPKKSSEEAGIGNKT